MKPINIAITAACFSGNKGAAAMLQSSIKQLKERYGEKPDLRGDQAVGDRRNAGVFVAEPLLPLLHGSHGSYAGGV